MSPTISVQLSNLDPRTSPKRIGPRIVTRFSLLFTGAIQERWPSVFNKFQGPRSGADRRPDWKMKLWVGYKANGSG